VLPLLTNRCCLAIGPNGVAIAKMPALGRRIIHKAFYPLTDSLDVRSNALYPLLNDVLAEHNSQKSQQLEVVLSSDFIRYMVLPAQINPLNATDRRDFSTAMYQEVFGALSNDWVIQSDDAPPCQPILCAAIDQSLLNHLKETASQYRFHLRSVLPYATQITNRLNLDKHDGFLAIIEPTRLILMEFKGALHGIHSVKWEDDWVYPLQKLLNKTILVNGLIAKNLIVYTSMHSELDAAAFVNWNASVRKPLPSLLEPSSHYQLLRGLL